MSTSKLAPDWLHNISEQPFRSLVSKLTQLLTMTTTHKFPPQVPRVEVDLRDKRGGGQTPLFLAVKNKSPQVVEMLVEAGASLDQVCMAKSVRVHIEEKMPGFNVDSLRATRAPLGECNGLDCLDIIRMYVCKFYKRYNTPT